MTPATPQPRHPLALLNIWPGDRVKVVGNTVPDDEEDYRGSLGMVRKIDPAEALPLFVFVDQADEEFGAVQFMAEELEVVTPGPISTYVAALRAQAEAEAVIEEEAQARYADRLRVEQIDRLIGDREWDEAMTDPAISALVRSNATHDRAYAARQATERLIWSRVAALAQAGGE